MCRSRHTEDRLTKIDEELRKNAHWIVVADESRAIVYGREFRRSPINELFVLDNAVAREKTADMITDKGGRSFDSHGHGRHTMAKEDTGPKQQQASVFAKDIVASVVHAQRNGDCRDFGLIAAPAFLGKLRDAISVAKNVDPEFEIDKNVVGKDVDFIERLLSKESS